MFLKILQNSQKNTCGIVSFFIKLQTKACNFIKKETLAKVFSCDFAKFLGTSFFCRIAPVAASLYHRLVFTFVECILFFYNISCEVCEIYKNTFFTEHLRMTASAAVCKQNTTQNTKYVWLCPFSNVCYGIYWNLKHVFLLQEQNSICR